MYSYREILDAQNRSLYESYEKNDTEAMQNLIKSLFYEPKVQTHTHEFESSTKLAEKGFDRHNHRFAGVTSEVIQLAKGNHKHTLFTTTDFSGHHHQVAVETSPSIDAGNGKHVHSVCGFSTVDDEHFHEFVFTTLINAPLLPISKLTKY